MIPLERPNISERIMGLLNEIKSDFKWILQREGNIPLKIMIGIFIILFFVVIGSSFYILIKTLINRDKKIMKKNK